MIYIGIDLGGTNIAVGAVDPSGKILTTFSVKTLAARPYQSIVKDMAFCISRILEKLSLTEADICSIGIGIPGLANAKEEKVIFCTNLGWKDIPLGAELKKYYNKPVFIDNDATVAGYAEYIAGVSKNTTSSVFLTLGTGVGSAIILNGKPYSGFHGVAGELGHTTLVAGGVPCSCGNQGCLERYCSATAIIRMAKEACALKPETAILQKTGGDPNRIGAKTVIDSAKEGDPVAVKVFDDYCHYLSYSIVNITHTLDPEMVILGGGVSHAGTFLLDRVNELVPGMLLYKTLPYPQICLARLGNEAGIIGAAMLGA